VQAHILVCFLALALWRTLEMWMQGSGCRARAWAPAPDNSSARSPPSAPDVVLPVRTAEGTRQLRLRTVAKPDRLVAELLQHLGLALPAGCRPIENEPENVVEKNTP